MSFNPLRFPVKKLLLALGLLVGLSAAQPAEATTYYVNSASGSNANNCTTAQSSGSSAKATIQNVIDNCITNGVGGEIIVQNGTYSTSNTNCTNTAIICVSKGGASAGVPLIIRAENEGQAVLTGSSYTVEYGVIYAADINYITLQGFRITEFKDDGIILQGNDADEGTGFRIMYNEIDHIGIVCELHVAGKNGIFIRRSNIHIEGNTFHHIGRYYDGEAGCMAGNVYVHGDHGIYIASDIEADNIEIVNNVFYRHDRGWAIQLYDCCGGPGMSNLVISNNTFAFGQNNPSTPYTQAGFIIFASDINNGEVSNNIGYDSNNGFAAYLGGYSPVFTARNNINDVGSFWEVLNAGDPGTATVSGTLANTDPGMVDPDNLNFHLAVGSASKDSGITFADLTSSGLALDHDHISRPQGAAFDRGAHETSDASVGTVIPLTATGLGQNGGTTGSFNTAQYDLGVIACYLAYYYTGGGASPTISDSVSNTYTRGTIYPSANGGIAGVWFYVFSPTTNAAHTWTVAVTNGYESLDCVGMEGNWILDTSNGNAENLTSNVSTQPGSVTPSLANGVILQGLALDGAGTTPTTISIGSSYTIVSSVTYGTNNSEGIYVAYLSQGSPAATNPDWGWTNNANSAAVALAFVSGGCGGSTTLPDTFTGSNGTLLDAYNDCWELAFGVHTLEIQSNGVQATSTTDTLDLIYRWLGTSPNADQFAEITLSSLAHTGWIGIMGRLDESTGSGYGAYCDLDTDCELIRFDNGTETLLDTAAVCPATKVLRMEITGALTSNISVLCDGVETMSATDATYLSGGAGVVTFSDGSRGDNFNTGSLVTETAGGTREALTGAGR